MRWKLFLARRSPLAAVAGHLGEPHFAFASAVGTTNIVHSADLGDVVVPKSFKAALQGPHKSYWWDAIMRELNGLIALRTWSTMRTCDLPKGAALMMCHFVFAIKRLASGAIEKFKARLVADGNTQKFGVDFDRVFATVVKTPTIRLVLIIAAAYDYNLTSIDIRQAYLQAELRALRRTCTCACLQGT